MKPLIELKNVSKIYKLDKVEIQVLNDINLKIDQKEFIVIMGPSGSGKSTMLHILGCLDKPTKGEVLVDDMDVSNMDDNSLAKIRREKVGFVFQFFYLIPTLTALDNVILPMAFSGYSQDRTKKAKELLEMVGLGNRIYHRPTELSGGERQRVAIARAMANNPSIILADEPTGNLDSVSGNEVIELLLKLNREKDVTLVIVTHDKAITSLSQKVINLKDGRIVNGTEEVN